MLKKRRSFDNIHPPCSDLLFAPKQRRSFLLSPSTEASVTPKPYLPMLAKHQNFLEEETPSNSNNPVPTLKFKKLNCWITTEVGGVDVFSRTDSPVIKGNPGLELFLTENSSPVNGSSKFFKRNGHASNSEVFKSGIRGQDKTSTQQLSGRTDLTMRKSDTLDLENNLQRMINSTVNTVLNKDDFYKPPEKPPSKSLKPGLKNIRKLKHSKVGVTTQTKDSNSAVSDDKLKDSTNTLTEVPKHTKKNWGKLNNVFQSILLFQREEVKSIADMHGIHHEINKFQLRNSTDGRKHGRPDLTKEDYAKDAFEDIRRKTLFTECASVGSPNHKDIMSRLILNDPRRYMLSPDDPDHLLNIKNTDGHTPLYTAAKNGNLNVVKLLIENNANPLISCKVSVRFKESETPIETAVKWNHLNIVQYLLEKELYSKVLVRKCLKYTTNRAMIELLEHHLGITSKSKSSTGFFSCFLKS